MTDTDANYHQYFIDAADIWESIIVGDLADIINNNGEAVDDLSIDITSFEEQSNVLGWAGPSQIRVVDAQTLGLPTNGLMGLNVVHMDQMIDDDTLTSVIAHEIGHILGLGTLWQDFDAGDQFVDGPWNQYGKGDLVENQFEYVGTNALEAYSEQTGKDELFVPLENGDSAPGAGSVGSHWSETVLGSELMTPIANGDLQLSSVTEGALADLGYEIVDGPLLEVQLTTLKEAGDYIKTQNLSTIGCRCKACSGLIGINDLSSYIEHLSKTDAITETTAQKINDYIGKTPISDASATESKPSTLEQASISVFDVNIIDTYSSSTEDEITGISNSKENRSLASISNTGTDIESILSAINTTETKDDITGISNSNQQFRESNTPENSSESEFMATNLSEEKETTSSVPPINYEETLSASESTTSVEEPSIQEVSTAIATGDSLI